jgi:hypothetical protein
MAICIHGTVWSGAGRPTCVQCLEAREERIVHLADLDLAARDETIAKLKADMQRALDAAERAQAERIRSEHASGRREAALQVELAALRAEAASLHARLSLHEDP